MSDQLGSSHYSYSPDRETDVNARHSTDATAEMPTVGSQPADGDQPDLWPLDEPEPAAPDPDADVLALGSELDQDPFDDDLAQRLERKAPRLKATRVTLALAAGLLLVIGFVGGSLAQKQWGKRPTASNPFATGNNRNGGNFPGGLGASGFPGAGRGNGTGTGGSAPITGTVKLVDGTTVYIVTSDGQVLTVKTGSSTTVSQPGSLSNLTAGSTVSITGQTGSDGTVTASSITKTK